MTDHRPCRSFSTRRFLAASTVLLGASLIAVWGLFLLVGADDWRFVVGYAVLLVLLVAASPLVDWWARYRRPTN